MLYLPTTDEPELCIHTALELLAPFNPLENACRNYFRMMRGLDFCTPEERIARTEAYEYYSQKIRHTSPSLPYDILPGDKDTFFPDGPIHLMKHARYIPAGLHKHEFFEFFYVLQGACTHVCDNTSYSLSAGDFCLWQFNIPHYIQADCDDCLAVNILIQKSAFQSYFFGILSEQHLLSTYFKKILYGEGDSPMLLFRTGNDRKLLALICAMYLEYQKKPVHWQSLITSYLGFLFVYLLRDHQEHLITAPESSAYDPSLQIFQYIQAHYDTVTLEMLCENFSYTAAYLSRLIKKKSGMTFSQIVTRLRIDHGAWLLANTERNIAQIAAEIGCADSSHFGRLFQKYYGCTPGAYRKQNGAFPPKG